MGLGPIGRGDVAQAERVEYRFDADFYNGRDLPVGLRALEVVFHLPRDLPLVDRKPSDARTRRTVNAAPKVDALGVLNILPKQLLHVEVVGWIHDPTRLESCERVELRAKYPDGGMFSHELAKLDPTVLLT